MDTWIAEPHTLAKIEILRKYLDAWFPIMGRHFVDRDVFYIDGFAGPGRYKGGEPGSPLVALDAGTGALVNGFQANRWNAQRIVCLFVEPNKDRLNSLTTEVERRQQHSWVESTSYLGEFDSIISQIKTDYPTSFRGSPVFVFIDPFGPTGLSFDTVASILGSPSSECLLHFDADGAERMIRALEKGFNQSSLLTLNRVFGDNEWQRMSRAAVDRHSDFDTRSRGLVNLYLQKIRRIAGYAFPFQMITPHRRAESSVGYYLIFASNHPLGLEKMKGVMKTIGQGGQYRFSNFASRQPFLFDAARSKEADAEILLAHFRGQSGVPWGEIRQVTLNETDLISPKAALKVLELRGSMDVGSYEPRKRGTYPDRLLDRLRFDFRKDGTDGEAVSN